MTDPTPSAIPSDAIAPKNKIAFHKRKWVQMVAVGFVAFWIGAVIATTDPTTSDEYISLESRNENLKLNLEGAREKAALVDQVDGREAELDAREAVMDERTSSLDSADAEMVKREKAVGVAETEIEENTITDGLYEVGVDMKAGQYKRDAGGTCYYAVLNSSDTFDIANNNNVSGPATVSVGDGQYFESNGCGSWVRQ